MGNIDIDKIKLRGFEQGSKEALVEDYCRRMASQHTDRLIEAYNRLGKSWNGRYINSDLMKMIFPFYANSYENRGLYNLSISNSAATLTNEAYMRAILRADIARCIFIAGPYGAGKSYFVQSLFESEGEGLLKDSIVYEGSITPPYFKEKIDYAIENDVQPSIIALNPTLELSIRNIKERARQTGRDVIKPEVIDKFANLYRYLKELLEEVDIPFTIYSKSSNITIDLSGGSQNLDELYHGTYEEVSDEYDKIIAKLESELEINE